MESKFEKSISIFLVFQWIFYTFHDRYLTDMHIKHCCYSNVKSILIFIYLINKKTCSKYILVLKAKEYIPSVKMHVFLTWLSMQLIVIIVFCLCMKIRFSSSSLFFSSYSHSRFFRRPKHEIEHRGSNRWSSMSRKEQENRRCECWACKREIFLAHSSSLCLNQYADLTLSFLLLLSLTQRGNNFPFP